jgi:hypothetical protein
MQTHWNADFEIKPLHVKRTFYIRNVILIYIFFEHLNWTFFWLPKATTEWILAKHFDLDGTQFKLLVDIADLKHCPSPNKYPNPYYEAYNILKSNSNVKHLKSEKIWKWNWGAEVQITPT